MFKIDDFLNFNKLIWVCSVIKWYLYVCTKTLYQKCSESFLNIVDYVLTDDMFSIKEIGCVTRYHTSDDVGRLETLKIMKNV